MPLFKRNNSARSFRYQSANANANTSINEGDEEAKRGFLDLNLGQNEESNSFAQTLSGITSSNKEGNFNNNDSEMKSVGLQRAKATPIDKDKREKIGTSLSDSIGSGSSSIPLQDPLTPPTSPLKTHNTYFMSRSKTQPQALPYHRPWNRNLTSVATEVLPEDNNKNNKEDLASSPTMMTSQSWSQSAAAGSMKDSSLRMAISQPSYLNEGMMAVSDNGGKRDFRVSPLAAPIPTPAQRKQMIDSARRNTLRKAKAPSEYNIMIMGAVKTGKTSWIRTILSTLNLDACSDEVIISAANFGIAATSNHFTRETDPITPLPTKSIRSLEGIELQPTSLLPLSSLNQTKITLPLSSSSRGSIFSSSTSGGNKRTLLTICDTPGFDFEYEDEFEIDRKLSSISRFVEDKLLKTMTEEGKLARKSRGDSHIHLVLYFIDPLALVEKRESRKKENLQRRLGRPDEKRRSRSQSESHTRARSPGISRKQVDPNLYNRDDISEQRSQEEQEFGIDGLSEIDIKIITKMSKVANVLPVIAKADTLTASQMSEIRLAIRKSLKAAKIDLGVFDIASIKPKKKRSGGQMRPSESLGSIEAAAEEDVKGAPLDGGEKGEVKVIRLRSRRSYSAMEFNRLNKSNRNGENGHSLQHTEPLFSNEAADPDDLEEQVAHDFFMQSMPPAIFLPEPTRIQHRRKKTSSISKQLIDKLPEKSPFRIPPVPAIPSDLSNSNDTNADATLVTLPGSPIGTAISPDLEDVRPLPAQQMPHAPPVSTRFERNYRWGTVNVLDPEQCDFGLLRDTIFGTHAEMLKESTAVRYETFRTEQLEFKESLRQGKSGFV